jgi:hypothetical protein
MALGLTVPPNSRRRNHRIGKLPRFEKERMRAARASTRLYSAQQALPRSAFFGRCHSGRFRHFLGLRQADLGPRRSAPCRR